MFEEVCLVCGKQVEDGRAYCSDVCYNQDTTSPSISSASSPFSSPHIEYAVGGDVPALVPSTLGASLFNHRPAHYPVSSSSASSTSWSLVTDEEGDDPLLNVDSDWLHDGSDLVHENLLKLSVHSNAMYPSALSYARRPSGTNNRSTVPLLHRRKSSSSSSAGNAHGVPRSAPMFSYASPLHSAAEEDGDDEACNSDLEFTSAHRRLHHQSRNADGRKSLDKGSTIKGRSKRTRNRASLPAYFSLLTVTGSVKSSTPSLPSSSAAPQLSPSTPKLTLGSLPFSYGTLQGTPRGRRTDTQLTVREGRKSRSRSRSPRPPHIRGRITSIRQRVQQVFDDDDLAPQVLATRGRATVRRNSSPQPKPMLNGVRRSVSRTRLRGRLRPEELNGAGCTTMAPGYGSGRSGLVSRELARERDRGEFRSGFDSILS